MCSCERNKFSSCLQLDYPSFVLNGYITVSNSEHKTDSCQFPPKYWMKTHAYCTQKNTFKLTCLCSASPFKGKNKVKVNKSLNIKSEKYPNRLNGTNIHKIQRNNFLNTFRPAAILNTLVYFLSWLTNALENMRF